MNIQRVTLKDIAQKARTSVATASRALHNHPSIPASTCKRIQKLAQKMGYQHDPTLSELMRHLRTSRRKHEIRTLAWINHRSEKGYWTKNPWISNLWTGASRRAEELGYRIEEFWLGPREDRMTGTRLGQILATRNVAGVMVAPMPELDLPWDMDWKRFACISIGPLLADEHMPYVDTDDLANALHCCRYLAQHGYRRIGLVHSSKHFPTGGNPLQTALLQFHAEHKELPLLSPLLYRLELPDSNQQLLQWMKTESPDALVVDNSPICEELMKHGYRIPGNLSAVHLDIPVMSSNLQFTGIKNQQLALGRYAVDMLITRVETRDFGIPATPWRFLIQGMWVEGKTVA